ncbi:hypothetical protein APASM_1814 [Actinosynnema pretiosum subsp. pretiosum]|nr:hypothetical protein APASM_1814 [Actinosynnema pretiosum subsp. pretiosum]
MPRRPVRTRAVPAGARTPVPAAVPPTGAAPGGVLTCSAHRGGPSGGSARRSARAPVECAPDRAAPPVITARHGQDRTNAGFPPGVCHSHR